MRRILITTILVLCAICGMKAQSDTVTVHVDGTVSLESLMADYDKDSVSYLSITGKLSEDDYAFIRGGLLQELDVLDLKYAEIDSLPKNAFNCTLQCETYKEGRVYITVPKNIRIILPKTLEYVFDYALALKIECSRPIFEITGKYPNLGKNAYSDGISYEIYDPIVIKVSKDNIYCQEFVMSDELITEGYFWGEVECSWICSPDTSVLYYQNYNYTIVNIPEGIRILFSNIFKNRYIKEQTLVLPSTLDSIGDRAFRNICISFNMGHIRPQSYLICKAVCPPKLGEEVFVPNTGFIYEEYACNTTLYVPDESVDLYKETDGWKFFREIEPISMYYYTPPESSEMIKGANAVEIKYNEVDCTLQLSKPASRMMVYDVDGTQVLNNKITSQTIRLKKSLLGKPYSLAVIAFTDGTTEVVKLKH